MTAPLAEVRPRAWWYGVGGGLIGLGVVAAIAVFVIAFQRPLDEFRDLNDQVDSMDRFAVPGEAVVALDEPGDYVVFAEGDGVAPIGRVGAATVTVESTEPDARPLVLRSVGIDETYDFGGHAGRAALEFTVDEPGDYRVTVGPVPASVTGVAVGPPLDLFGAIGSVFVAIFVPLAVGGVFVLGGGVVLIVTVVRRSSSARRLRMATGPAAGAWAAAGGGAVATPPGSPTTSGAAPSGWTAPPEWPPPAWPSPTWPPPPTPPASPPPAPPSGASGDDPSHRAVDPERPPPPSSWVPPDGPPSPPAGG